MNAEMDISKNQLRSTGGEAPYEKKVIKDFSLPFQIMSFASEKFKFNAWVNKCHFGNSS